MRSARMVLALAGAVVLALSACGRSDKAPQLMNIRSDGTPDEFAILPPKALEMPTDLAALPEPTPGGANLTDHNPQADAVAEVMSAISTSTSSWSAENNIKTVDQVNELLAKLDALEASGVNLNSVGLGTLKTELITAKAAYESSIAADPSAENQQLALSQFRESVAKAKMNYLLSTGLSASDPKVQAEQKVMRSEDLWQYNLAAIDNFTVAVDAPKRFKIS